MVHHFYDYVYPRGWQFQINDEPQLSIKYDRRWLLNIPVPNGQLRSPLQMLPEVGLITGTLQNEIRAGMMFRAGFHLPGDFGPGELAHPADFTTSPETFGNAFERFLYDQTFYVFARPYGRLVAHNGLLQGNNFSNRDPVTVTPEPAVFAVQVGLVHRFLNYFEFAYTTTWQSPEFSGQGGWDSWSSIQLTFSTTF
jgi:lipid A 3-O-deacylase